ncbi:conserved unknown protein [Ectocarpus siliculosus]|uniref:Acyltransferase 3 domain-containing protein n=1 Tax=Ectocarpus siliculosus TaxID=2880 RepID=D8LM88_ECTSI|nr:conserved unknown protein [Ectocarpus siliculosus]|eukprot:CBN77498.1 conserved unknown protein [Ectocarpus siliculosus]
MRARGMIRRSCNGGGASLKLGLRWLTLLLSLPAAASGPGATSREEAKANSFGTSTAAEPVVRSPAGAEARYADGGPGDVLTPSPTAAVSSGGGGGDGGVGKGPCKIAIERMLSPAMDKCLAVANDASSALNLDAFYLMQPLMGYPGQIGDYDQCSKVALFDPSIQAVMQTHHCLAGSLSLASNEGNVPFGGLCVPEACSPDILSLPAFRSWLVQKALELDSSGTSTETAQHFLYNLQRHSQLAADMHQGLTCGTYQKPTFGWDAIAVTSGLCLLLVLIVYATCADLFNGADYPQSGQRVTPNSNRAGPQRIKYAGRNPVEGGGGGGGGGGGDVYVLQQDHINKNLAAFSIPRNLGWLFSVGEANELSVFDGLRVLSMLWVVLGHILAVQASIGYINPETVMPPRGLLATVVGQVFFSARFSVDTFFFVSGFLVVYAMLRRFKLDGNGAKVQRVSSWLPFFYLHRLLRITPSYVFSLLLWWKLAVFMGEGPFWYRWEFFIGLCDKFWWSNVTYLNNLVPWHQGETGTCFYPTWYLADDMQFYMVSPVFIVLYMRRKWWGVAATFLAIVASTAAMAIGTYVRGWSALTLDGSWVVKYSEETYTAPYFRIVSYLMGMLFAMLWHEKQMRWPQFKLADWQRYIMLSTSAVIFFVVTFVGYSGYQNAPCSIFQDPASSPCGSGWTASQLALYNAGTRPAWGFALILLCFVCFNGQGGLLQQWLAHRAWAPLARLSFGAYLLHPLVINLWFLNSTTKFHFSKLDLFMSYVCVSGVTFSSALIMALIVESPLTKLGRRLENIIKPRERVHKVSTEYFAAEQSPGNIERHVLQREDSDDDFLEADGREEEDFFVDDVGRTPSPMRGPMRAAGGGRGGSGGSNRNGVSSRLAGMQGGAAGGTRGEMAALVANTNPGYHDYMSEVTPRRRGSEAFG